MERSENQPLPQLLLIANAKVFHELLQVSEPYVFLLFFFSLSGGYSIAKDTWRQITGGIQLKSNQQIMQLQWFPAPHPSEKPFLNTICYLNDFTMLMKLFCQCLQTFMPSARFSAEKELVICSFGLPSWLNGKKSTWNTGDAGDAGSIPPQGCTESDTNEATQHAHIYMFFYVQSSRHPQNKASLIKKKLQSSCNFQKLSMHCCMHQESK